nr:hypothetical protein CFP56_78697 [Quercus suber]
MFRNLNEARIHCLPMVIRHLGYNKDNKSWRWIAATTSVVFVIETTTRAGEARVAATSARDSSSKHASQAQEQTLDDSRTYN